MFKIEDYVSLFTSLRPKEQDLNPCSRCGISKHGRGIVIAWKSSSCNGMGAELMAFFILQTVTRPQDEKKMQYTNMIKILCIQLNDCRADKDSILVQPISGNPVRKHLSIKDSTLNQ
ncbi:unnamed protein product [Ceratitis capitata]|uniref:(Mediterranean fruit fly) hypothetical protein n=1 Tax=Ceratitis capitata TaxID=7213 RepID=A0A811U2X4_CERCA|nr:unnamed protein product [Ceratitis capitata]